MEEYASTAAKKSIAWSKEGMIDHIQEYGLTHRVMNLTSDNVSTNNLAMKELQKLRERYERQDPQFYFDYRQQCSQ